MLPHCSQEIAHGIKLKFSSLTYKFLWYSPCLTSKPHFFQFPLLFIEFLTLWSMCLVQMTDIIQTITQIEEIPQLEQVLKGRRECYYRNIKRTIYFFFYVIKDIGRSGRISLRKWWWSWDLERGGVKKAKRGRENIEVRRKWYVQKPAARMQTVVCKRPLQLGLSEWWRSMFSSDVTRKIGMGWFILRNLSLISK